MMYKEKSLDRQMLDKCLISPRQHLGFRDYPFGIFLQKSLIIHDRSANRDKAASGPLYASSQIAQTDYEFSNIFKAVEGFSSPASVSIIPSAQPPLPSMSSSPSSSRSSVTVTPSLTSVSPSASALNSSPRVSATPVPGTLWPSKVFAPYLDILLWPTLDASVVAKATGVKRFTLAFVVADTTKQPSWGGVIPMSQNFYMNELANLRAVGGDVIISFGGANGNLCFKKAFII